MKKTVIVFFIVSFFAFSVLPSFAMEQHYFAASGEKAARGIINTLTGWLEVPAQAAKGYRNGFPQEGKNKAAGGILGLLRGIVHAAGRTTSGVLQLVTFMLPNHPDNEGVGIPLDAQYAWQEGRQYSVFKDGVSPVGEKALRGLQDAFGGILEAPAQLSKPSCENKFVDGIVRVCKAIIYPVARVLSGTFDLATVLLPNDTETYGYSFNEKHPWSSLEKMNEGQEGEAEVLDMFVFNMDSP